MQIFFIMINSKPNELVCHVKNKKLSDRHKTYTIYIRYQNKNIYINKNSTM